MKKETLTGLSIITFAAFYIWIQNGSNPFDKKEILNSNKLKKHQRLHC